MNILVVCNKGGVKEFLKRFDYVYHVVLVGGEAVKFHVGGDQYIVVRSKVEFFQSYVADRVYVSDEVNTDNMLHELKLRVIAANGSVMTFDGKVLFDGSEA